MTNPAGFDFTKFVPGFDFLKNLTPGGGAATHSAAPGWVAPTLDPEELEKRIQELKTVLFWLEQNSKAVGATIQALEVQRMTLNTLKGMNMSFNDLAESLKAKTQDAAQASASYSFTNPAAAKPETAQPKPAAVEPEPEAQPSATKADSKKAVPGVDPSQWWGALTEQFQHIATHAMNDMAHRANVHASTETDKPATKKAAAGKTTARKTAARKTTAAKTPARKSAAKSKR